MGQTIRKRRRLIAAQAALVFALIAIVYFGLLRPSSQSPLTGAGVPGRPHSDGQRLHAGRQGNGGHPRGHRHPNQGGGNANPPGGGGAFAQQGGPSGLPQAPTTPISPNSPTGDQYLGSVAALKAKLGISEAKAR